MDDERELLNEIDRLNALILKTMIWMEARGLSRKFFKDIKIADDIAEDYKRGIY